MTLTGAHLKLDSVVKFDSALATVKSTAPDGSSAVVKSPARSTPATVGITITNTDDGDELTTTTADAYSYMLMAATITTMSASTAVPGTQITISGTSFVNVSSVEFGTATRRRTPSQTTTPSTRPCRRPRSAPEERPRP